MEEKAADKKQTATVIWPLTTENQPNNCLKKGFFGNCFIFEHNLMACHVILDCKSNIVSNWTVNNERADILTWVRSLIVAKLNFQNRQSYQQTATRLKINHNNDNNAA